MKINPDSALSIIKERIKSHTSESPLVIAIDGMAASGKTTFAERLSLPVIHTDDFYRPRNQRGELEISDYSGNFDLERFKKEVVANIKKGKPFRYGVFDCKQGIITHEEAISEYNCIVVEGAYSTHPELGTYADIKLFFEIGKQEQKKRIIMRNGEKAYKAFSSVWIPAEQRYHTFYKIKENSDIIVSTEV